MRIPVNLSCNVRTAEHVGNPRLKVDITIPSLRAVLTVTDAKVLLRDLAQAIHVAEREALIAFRNEHSQPDKIMLKKAEDDSECADVI